MSDEIKLKWETVTKWVFRFGIGLMSIVFTIGGKAVLETFTEMRADIKTVLKNQNKLEGQLEVLDIRTTRNEKDIDKLRDK